MAHNILTLFSFLCKCLAVFILDVHLNVWWITVALSDVNNHTFSMRVPCVENSMHRIKNATVRRAWLTQSTIAFSGRGITRDGINIQQQKTVSKSSRRLHLLFSRCGKFLTISTACLSCFLRICGYLRLHSCPHASNLFISSRVEQIDHFSLLSKKLK